MTTIASLLVTIGADISGLKQGLDDTESGINNLGGRLQSGLNSIGGTVVRTGAALTELTSPLRDFGAQGLQTASNFDSIMAEISARTGVVGTDLDQVRQFALQMGADTSFSAQQAGDAFLQLLSSGQTTQEAFATLPAVLDAAAASGEDLGHTADVVTDIMAAFSLPVDNAKTVVDALSAAAGASSADMASLGQGFASVGGIAKSAGLNVEDTAAILAILAENGTKGVEAGTALKSMLLNMQRPTDSVKAAWDELGLSMYDAAGAPRDLTQVIGDLDGVLDGLPIEDQNRLMYELAGSYGITALTALRGSISIDKMKDSMSKQASASEVAQARMDTFKGRMDSLMGSVETLMITALTPLMNDVLSPLAEQVTGLVNNVTDWADANPQLSNTLVVIGGALAFIGPALVAVGTAITLAAPAVGVLGVVLAALASPIVLVGAALAGLAYVASQFIDFAALAETIKTSIGTALADANIDLSALPTKISDAINSLDFSQVQTDLETAISDLDIGDGVKSALAAPIDTSGITATVEGHFDEILTAMVGVVGIVFGGPISMGFGIAKLVSLAIDNDFLGIGTLLQSSGITDVVATAFNDLKTDIDGVIQSIFSGDQQKTEIDIGSKFALKNADDIGGAQLSGPLATFVSDLRLGMDSLKNLVDTVWANIAPGVQSIADGIKGFIANVSTADTEGLLRVVTGIAGFIGGIAELAIEMGSDVLGTLLTSIGAALPAIGSAISSFISAVSDIGSGNWSEVAGDVQQGMIDIGQAALNFLGIDIQIPSFDEALQGWQTFADSVNTIIQYAADQVAHTLNDIAVDVRTTFRDIEEILSRAQIAGADVNNLLGRGNAINDATRAGAVANVDAIELARNTQDSLTSGLASGDITLDPSKYINVDYAALATKITDPLLIQDALTQAMAEGDQQALNVLLPLATELGIDTQSLVDQFANSLTVAGAAQIYQATLTADVLVQAGKVNLGPLRGAINDALRIDALNNSVGGGGGAQTAPIHGAATGARVLSNGLVYAHQDELIVNRSQQASMGGGRGGQIGSLVIQTNDANKLLFDLKVMGIDLEALAKQE